MPNLRAIAEATPASRDRYVDFLRALSILVVVVGHWFVTLLYWTPDAIGAGNVIGFTPLAWLLTWFLMVMPVFFFVGGFANATTLGAMHRRGESTGTFLRTRAWRLLRPSLVFIGVWVGIDVIFHVADMCTPRLVRCVDLPPETVPFGPLWFLLVYLGVILLAPLTLWLHERVRWLVVVALIAFMVIDDVLAFGMGISWVRWPNGAWVWLLAHQLGYFYADGTLVRWPRWRFWLGAAAGFAGLAVLTNIGVYPRSLIGTGVEDISNVNPPTLPILALVFWMLSAAMLLRPVMLRWLERTRVWMATIYVNSVIMTLFLWHMTAFLLAMLVLWPLGFGHQTDSTLAWWLERPLWIVVPSLFLAVLVVIFGRFERPRPTHDPKRGTEP